MDDVLRGAGAPPHYPWHRWTDGAAWKVTWGEDYYVSDKAFRAAAYAHAKSHGLTVTTRSVDGGLIIHSRVSDGADSTSLPEPTEPIRDWPARIRQPEAILSGGLIEETVRHGTSDRP